MALTWQQTEVTVTEGETATVTWTESSGMTSASMMIALSQIVVGDSSVATAVWEPNVSNVGGVATGSAIFTGVSAGTTTVTGTTIDTEQTNTLTIVVVSADDESYLNKRGLAHFWENIDDIKQDKLTAGANITIAADNTISASQPTVNDATLTIQRNGTNVQTFTANASSNVTANISVPTQTSELTNNSGFLTSSTGVTSVNGNTGAVTGLQTTSNLVTSVSSSSTNSQYPSAKLFYDTVGDVESVLQTLNSGSGAA